MGQNTVSVEDIKLVQLRDIPKQCYWRYDSTNWKGTFFLKAQKFNPQKHNQNTIRQHKEQLEMESSDKITELKTANDNGSSTENESEEDSDDIDTPLANLQE